MATEQDFCYSKITVIPLVLSVTGVISCMLNQSVTALNLPSCVLSQVMKVVLLNTCSIVRKFLVHEVHLLMKRLITPNRIIIPILLFLDATPQCLPKTGIT